MVEVEVSRVIKQPYPLVVLKEKGGEASLQILVGPFEALAISLAHNRQTPPRPVSYDLARQIIEEVDSRVQRIEITDLNKGIYYAELYLADSKGAIAVIDARPSDAIAIALRTGSPIFTDPTLFEEETLLPLAVAADPQETVLSPPKDSELSAAPSPAPLQAVSRLELLRKRLLQAVSEEAYEEAARLRDEICRIEAQEQL
jgi:uncharacterized protein